MKIIVGLGNFGDEYAYTFHNMGFLAIDCLSGRFNVKVKNKECSALTGVGSLGGEKVVLSKPLTYMNLSGKAVKQLAARYGADYSDFIIIYDDIDIPRATVRVRQNGSAGTHNGMRSVIAECGTQNIPRIRIGIGKPETGSLADYVLSAVPRGERQQFASAVESACDECVKLITGK